MAVWRRLVRGVRALADREAADRAIADEVDHYYAETVAALLAEGLGPAEARRAARLRLGEAGNVRERMRASGWENGVSTVVGDARHAVRRLRRSPGFTAVAVLTLGVGIGASTAIFSAVNPILLEALPYPDAGRVVMVWDRSADGSRADVTFGTYRELVERSRSFAALAVLRAWQPTFTGAGEAERIDGQRVSAAFFRTLGVAPAVGTDFSDRDDLPGGARVVILNHALWQRRFGGAPVVGRPIVLDDVPHTVIGIMPAGFENVLAPGAGLWAPLQYDPALPVDGREWGHHLRMVGRLAASTEDATQELGRIADAPVAEFPRAPWASLEHRLTVIPLQEEVTRAVRPALVAVLGAVLLLLAIACVNVTNLLLARGAQRRSEMALRSVLGAGRPRLIAQMITESLLLALMGGAVGVAVAAVGVRALLSAVPPDLPRTVAIRLDPAALGFALVVTTVVGLVTGVIPALQASRRGPGAAVRRGSRRLTGSDPAVRRALVVAEVVLAVVLLVSGGLLLRSLQRLFSVDPGFRAAQLLTVQVQTAGRRFDDEVAVHRFFEEALEAVRALPGVASAAFTSQLPLSGDRDLYGVHFETRPAESPEEDRSALRYAVTPGYFRTLGIPLRAGRLLDGRDGVGAPGAVVISEALARRRFPDADPIGQRVRIGGPDLPWSTVVGVVGDVTHTSLAVSHEDIAYLPTVQGPFADRSLWLVVRARTDAAGLAPAVRVAIASIDRNVPLSRVATMDDRVATSAAQRRFTLIVFECFAAAALLLAAVGLYGVLAGGVAERTREIGVRAALGASRAGIVRLVLRQGLTLTGLGVAIGLAASVAASRALASMLFGVSPLDPPTWGAVLVLLFVVAALASSVPAWRAARVDPSSALRAE